MKVAHLIQKLSEMDPDLDVVVDAQAIFGASSISGVVVQDFDWESGTFHNLGARGDLHARVCAIFTSDEFDEDGEDEFDEYDEEDDE